MIGNDLDFISAARCPKCSQPLALDLGRDTPFDPFGVSRSGGSPAAGSSDRYGWPLEFEGSAPNGKVTAGLERVTVQL